MNRIKSNRIESNRIESNLTKFYFFRDEIKNMFYHGYENYIRHAFPMDELKPLSCQGVNSMGRYCNKNVHFLDKID
jgi:hypothetical protein